MLKAFETKFNKFVQEIEGLKMQVNQRDAII